MQKPHFLIADDTIEVQGLLKRWFDLFYSVFILFYFTWTIPSPTSSSPVAVFSSKMLLPLRVLPFLLFIWLRSDVQTDWQRHLLKTEHSLRPNRILACGSGIHAFLLLVQQMDERQHWSSWQLYPFSFRFFLRETVHSLPVLGPRSKIVDEHSL